MPRATIFVIDISQQRWKALLQVIEPPIHIHRNMKFIAVLFSIIVVNWPVQAHLITPQGPLQPTLPETTSLLSLLSLHKSLVEYSSITGNESTVTQFLVSYLQS